MESTNYDRINENNIYDEHYVMEFSLNPHYHDHINV